jgi:hypothetical protein
VAGRLCAVQQVACVLEAPRERKSEFYLRAILHFLFFEKRRQEGKMSVIGPHIAQSENSDMPFLPRRLLDDSIVGFFFYTGSSFFSVFLAFNAPYCYA